MSLYLKYRPRSFADVCGQDHVVTTLEHAVKKDQLVHAYLFFGPRGTGKTSVARILAKILLIRGIEDENLQRQIIQSVDDGTLVDLIEIDAASNRGIDDVRDLKEKVQFSPNVASAKVYIVDEVHMMTKEAFNALLKTLEEPPNHAFFILATTELHKVPDTIQSRCQRFPFRPITDEDIIRHLQNLADKERIKVSRGALRAIAGHVNGGMRDAISILDQLSSLDGIEEKDVRLRIGESAEEEVLNLWDALDGRDRRKVLGIISSLQEKGVSLEVFLRQFISYARRMMHADIDSGSDITDAVSRIDAAFCALKDLRVSPVPSVALEVALVELCSEEETSKARPAAKRVRDVKEKAKLIVAKASENRQSASDAVHVGNTGGKGDGVLATTFVAEELNLENLKMSWDDIVGGIRMPAVKMSLKDAIVDAVDGVTVRLLFSSDFHRDTVADVASRREVENAIRSKFHREIVVQCLSSSDQASVSAEKEHERDGRNVNMVDAVSEIFK